MKIKFKIRKGKITIDMQGTGSVCETHSINDWIKNNFNVLSCKKKQEYYVEPIEEKVHVGIKKD